MLGSRSPTVGLVSHAGPITVLKARSMPATPAHDPPPNDDRPSATPSISAPRSRPRPAPQARNGSPTSRFTWHGDRTDAFARTHLHRDQPHWPGTHALIEHPHANFELVSKEAPAADQRQLSLRNETSTKAKERSARRRRTGCQHLNRHQQQRRWTIRFFINNAITSPKWAAASAGVQDEVEWHTAGTRCGERATA